MEQISNVHLNNCNQRNVQNWNRAGEGAAFSRLSQYMNDLAVNFLKANSEESYYNLLDDGTGMPCEDISTWAAVYLSDSTYCMRNPNETPTLLLHNTDDGEYYEYDSNHDGNFETKIYFNNDGSFEFASVNDETGKQEWDFIGYSKNNVLLKRDEGLLSYSMSERVKNENSNYVYTRTDEFSPSTDIIYLGPQTNYTNNYDENGKLIDCY